MGSYSVEDRLIRIHASLDRTVRAAPVRRVDRLSRDAAPEARHPRRRRAAPVPHARVHGRGGAVRALRAHVSLGTREPRQDPELLDARQSVVAMPPSLAPAADVVGVLAVRLEHGHARRRDQHRRSSASRPAVRRSCPPAGTRRCRRLRGRCTPTPTRCTSSRRRRRDSFVAGMQ